MENTKDCRQQSQKYRWFNQKLIDESFNCMYTVEVIYESNMLLLIASNVRHLLNWGFLITQST